MSKYRIGQQTKFYDEMNDIEKQREIIKQKLAQPHTEKNLLKQVGQWERDSLGMIQIAAKQIRLEIQNFIKGSNSRINIVLNRIANEIRTKRIFNNCTEHDIEHFNTHLQTCEGLLKRLTDLKIIKYDLPSSDLIKIAKTDAVKLAEVPLLPVELEPSTNESNEEIQSDIVSPKAHFVAKKKNRSDLIPTVSQAQSDLYPSICFNVDASGDKNIQQLFERLRSLAAMLKNGPMSGDCDPQTTQMETFLSRNFGFTNISDEYIVQGVKAFRLAKPLSSLNPKTIINFPGDTKTPFAMTVQEILDWQRSYAVYADHTVAGMTQQFLHGALQGISKSGDEASRMKFVVRISQCPILMEFNARIIPRELQHPWPHRIKLVSVTGIDFAGRIHDINDITTYVSNWKDVYQINPKSGYPVVHMGRDFLVKPKGPRGQLHEKLLLNDLMRMARLRLRVCDKEKVQIVVETGIGLGVFAGKLIGVDERVRALSAQAVRIVLEEDGASYENICGVVFALPIFDGDRRDGRQDDVYQAFADEFETNRYKGCIPVLIADQDMHRVTVAIALEGYHVSELNPADSHGVFGEYWQNRGPAVEEKLALTTLGLLVQHHLINPYVSDLRHYHIV